MKKTSRRSFGKLMTGAIAALPVASLSARANATLRTNERTATAMPANRYHENTPPPVEINDGSFAFLVKTPTQTKPLNETGSGPYLYKGKVDGSTDNNIEHIKILHGSGEWVYRDLEATGSMITIELQDYDNGRAGTLVVSGDTDAFQVLSTGYGSGNANGQLSWSRENGRPHYKHHFMHRGGPGNKEFRVTGIRITKGGATTLNLALPSVSANNPFESQGYRILVWLRD